MADHPATFSAILMLLTIAAGVRGQYARNTFYSPPHRGQTPVRLHPCEQSSCYPATGNLLLGREERLHASSTCGLRGQQRYCIVSHLEDPKKCFWCNTSPNTENNPLLNHRIGNIVYRLQPGTRKKSWWQSENGKENVTIQLDMEAEFHFTHLIIVFKTFRPAAMFIERSYDFGRTWQIYRYFAHNCEESFPSVPTHPSRKLTDVVCESRYSNVDPSTGGEIIFRVLPPNLHIDDPYSIEVQNLLKMTNLRVNFTKLHTLGDDLLDNRDEIQEKYYYAITDMIVRGSCSCYGHASRCLPLSGAPSKTDMVHGRCECTHNTRGLNCEVCEDFFNDLPWKPALGKQTNACRRCSCNNHATGCHFDAAVYEATGNVSGGVCDDCQHNTMGRSCEMCKPFFYQDPLLDIQDPDVCKPCDCDPRGAMDNGICDSTTDVVNNLEAGKCHCKQNVEGRRCDHCKNGFWNFDENNPDGCQACTCNTLGTINNQGCNLYSGVCTCKRYVTGRDCNQCSPQHWGLSDDRDGCRACECDPGGSIDNDCDVITGQCRCRDNVEGRTCNRPKQQYYIAAINKLLHEAEFAKCVQNCQIIIREPYRDGRESTWTGTGFMRASENGIIEFDVDGINRSMDYDIIVRYEPQVPGQWDDVTITIIRNGTVDPNGPCANARVEDDSKRAVLPHDSYSAKIFPPVCFEAGEVYKVILEFHRQNPMYESPSASILIDSIVFVPRIDSIPFFQGSAQAENMRLEYERMRCDQYSYDVVTHRPSEMCQKLQNSIGLYAFNGAFSCQCDVTGSTSNLCSEYNGACQCKPNVVGRRCERCAPGTYGFGPDGCRPCDCNSIGALDNFCDVSTGQCKCRPNTYGRECDLCQPGFWNFPHCEHCNCNGHADTCDSRTGACTSCRDYTYGHRCERCIDGHYGDPILGQDIPCRPCPCPSTVESGHSYASTCHLDPLSADVVCECDTGYAGSRCDVCADNYFGRPEIPGGRCEPCDCNNNINIARPGNCDPLSGKCLKCEFNTEGDHCEICKDGYFGKAKEQQCQECVCNVLGTDASVGSCDKNTGQCPCLHNVIGLECDTCRPNHWKIASGEGCEPCECDPIGSVAEQCNVFDGQCECKSGFGGRRCNQCQANHWGDPNVECHACICELSGSLTMQCNHADGSCVCIPGVGGHKCNKCARGYLGDAPYCQSCGECFENWDFILDELKNQTNVIIDEAKKIKTIGATGAYTSEFKSMEKELNGIDELLKNASNSTKIVADLEESVTNLRSKYNTSLIGLQLVEDELDETVQKISLAKLELDDLKDKGDQLKEQAANLKYNNTQLQAGIIEGALKLTEDAKHRALLAQGSANKTQEIISNAERQRKRTEILIQRAGKNYNDSRELNEKNLEKLQEQLSDLKLIIPDLNEKICGMPSDTCDSLCGGAGCGSCGGITCENGAFYKVEQALDYGTDAENKIKDKERQADNLLRSLNQAKPDVMDARKKAKEAFDVASEMYNKTEDLLKQGEEVIKEANEVLLTSHTSPADIRSLTNETLNMKIKLEENQIKELGDDINRTLRDLTDIDNIIRDTESDLKEVEKLKGESLGTKNKSESVLERATAVVTSLDDARTAQDLADAVLRKANDNIETAQADLSKINTESVDANASVNKTEHTVRKLEESLSQLQQNFSKHDKQARDFSDKANIVLDSARNSLEKAKELRNKYRRANISLSEKIEQSNKTQTTAQNLLERANKLTVTVSNQFKTLQGMEESNKTNEQSMYDITNNINEFLNQTNQNLETIKVRSEHYRVCT